MITPGPVVITVGFIGYLVAGLAGATIAAIATFMPCYLFTVIPAPYFKRLQRNQAIKAFVDGVTAAATGAIAGAVFVLGRRALVDATTAAIAAVTLLVLVRVKRVPEPLLIAAAGVLGILLGGAPVAGPARGGVMDSSQPAGVVVFVCEHGSAKSLVAASFFERLAAERGLMLRAVSRGAAPDAGVPPKVAEALRRDGFEVASYRPQPLTESDVASAIRVVTIGVETASLVPTAAARAERWDDIPPVSAGYAAARAALLSRLEALLRELERAHTTP
jgi:chromate transport protein ChrA